MQSLTPKELNIIEQETKKKLIAQRNKPLVVSVMGQTGVGKTSLIHALFNLDIDRRINSVRPTTRKMESHTLFGANGQTLVFHDMPGIGEAEETDMTYLEEYRQYFLASDIVIWAIHVDNRSVTFDMQALRFMLKNIEPEQQRVLISKITFVLTKADVLVPSPWIMGYLGNYVIFTPGTATKEILREKEVYYQAKFIYPFGGNIVGWTYNDNQFNLSNIPSFKFDDYSVYYHGLLTREMTETYKKSHPEFTQIFERLYDNYRVIPCSALFKYNLTQLLLVILNKLGPDVIESFKQFINTDLLSHVSLERARQMCNIRIFDLQSRRKVFDLSDGTFPDKKGNRLF